jgi:predicted nucleic acid-binding protein
MLQEEAIFVSDPVQPPRVVPHDPKDDYLVAMAIDTKTNALVTRDQHFENVSVKGLEIMNPRQFINKL